MTTHAGNVSAGAADTHAWLTPPICAAAGCRGAAVVARVQTIQTISHHHECTCYPQCMNHRIFGPRSQAQRSLQRWRDPPVILPPILQLDRDLNGGQTDRKTQCSVACWVSWRMGGKNPSFLVGAENTRRLGSGAAACKNLVFPQGWSGM
jgi:hypothetical protein